MTPVLVRAVAWWVTLPVGILLEAVTRGAVEWPTLREYLRTGPEVVPPPDQDARKPR